MPLLKNKDDLARLKVLVKIFFDIQIKSHSHRKVMNVRDTSYHGDTLMCQT